jgi:uncharacterized protein (DUF2147 family)
MIGSLAAPSAVIRSALALALFGASPPAFAAGPNDELLGTWRNPNNSVHVELVACGDALCGNVVWASDKAKENARRAGTDPLIGASLLRDFVRTRDGNWRGKVFVPDLGKTLTGRVVMIDPRSFRAQSCALGVLCRSQVWTRLT